MYEVRSTTVMPWSGAVISRDHVTRNQLAMELGVSVERLHRLRALEVQVKIVFPGEADAAVHLDGVAAHLPRALAHVRLADRGCDGRILGARVERPRRVVHGRVRVLH